MTKLGLALCLTLLVGCVPIEQDTSRAQAICTGAGRIEGTVEYEGCIARQMDNIASSRMQTGSAIATGLQVYGQGATAPRSYAPSYSPPTYRAPMNCTSYRNGTMLNTTCY